MQDIKIFCDDLASMIFTTKFFVLYSFAIWLLYKLHIL